jgi:hypothetical protein
MAGDRELIEMAVTCVVDLLCKDEVTPLELLDALEARVAAVD